MKNNNMLHIMGLGGLCWTGAILKRIPTSKYYKCPTYNIRHQKGIELVKYLFNGQFIDIINKGECKKVEKLDSEKYPYDTNGDYKYEFQDYVLIHDNYDEKFLGKTHDLYDGFLRFLELHKEHPNYIFVYGCNMHDKNYTDEELYEIKSELSKYINLERFFIIGSISEPSIKHGDMYEGRPVRHKYNYNNDNFKTVFCDRYIELYPANVFCLCAENLEKIIRDKIHI